MPFARYVDPPGGEKRFKEVNRALAERDATSLRRILKDETTFLKLLDTPTAAELDGSAAAGPFPILVYSSGLNDTAASGSLLAEYLASHGFVVVSVPQLGSDYGRFSLGVNPVDMETQIRDLEFAAAVVRELPFADRDRLAVGGHSMGGVAALVYQMRHPEVGAIVGLDASYGSRDLKSVLTSSAYYRPGRVRVPLLDLRRADAQVDLSAIDALDFSDRYFLEFSGVAHADFTTFPMIAMRFPTDIQGRTPEAARTAFETTCRYIEHFLDATLRGGQQGKAFLAERPENNGVPKEVVTLRLRRGLAPPPTAVDFAQNVERNGLEEARRLLGAWQKRLPGRDIIEEPALNALGYDFLARARLRLATDLFRLNADAHPASANAYDSLAEGYLAQGDRSSAAQAYEKVLEILATDKGSGRPEDALRKNAKDKLRELKRGR
ncbi:MAG: chlorophyllase/cutinase-like alpha/beta fold protein [Gemmataceae bacterium]